MNEFKGLTEGELVINEQHSFRDRKSGLGLFSAYTSILAGMGVGYYGLEEPRERKHMSKSVLVVPKCGSCNHCKSKTDKKKKTTYYCDLKNRVTELDQKQCEVIRNG